MRLMKRNANLCRYRHECSFCFGTHPVSKCFKRPSNSHFQRDQSKDLMPVRLFIMHPWLIVYPDKEKAQLLINVYSTGFELPIFEGSGCQLSKKFHLFFLMLI